MLGWLGTPLTRWLGAMRAKRFTTRDEAVAELLIEVLSLAAQRFQEVAIAVLHQRDGILTLADADDVLDVPRPLLPSLDWLRRVSARAQPGTGTIGSSLPANGMQKVWTMAIL